ncbi:ATP-binding protein [Limosilactobacillus sp.]|uniref:ATP-binding protein n=1 Tax=Limosilactobacillus sp. TaxID=2773925 RepID=UPI003F07FB3D
MFVRSKQLDQLKNSISDGHIKVIYGVRRAGKTTLLEQFHTYLRRQGVASQRIIYRCFDRPTAILANPQNVFKQIKKELTAGKQHYVFLDELECLPNYNQLIQKLVQLPAVDLYVTSSETGVKSLTASFPCRLTYLGPLSFSEFVGYHHQEASLATLYRYLNTGGFPFAQEIRNHSSAQNYFEEVLNTIIINCFARQSGLCNPRLAVQLATFLTKRPGQLVNISQAVAVFQEAQVKVSNKTLATYLGLLQKCFLFAPCPELDGRTGRAKTTNVPYFPVDSCFNWLLTNRHGALSAANLTTVVFNELRLRGYDVYTNRTARHPVTFVAIRNGRRHFFQFNFSLLTPAALEQASNGLRHAPVDCTRTLITAKPYQGDTSQLPFHTVNLVDWLME